ncbi:MAG TPA: phosphate ABC transporter permease subunit PstC [Spirochaetota bacterium]|nr:phosphate ABC transporter permease subunit PstC [Spirochaetota bacterium]
MANQLLSNQNIIGEEKSSPFSNKLIHKKKYKINEKIYSLTLLFSGIVVLLIIGGIVLSLLVNSAPSIFKFGAGFLTGDDWNPVNDKFGALPFIVGTVMTGFLALIISLPFSLSISILLGEYFRSGWLSTFVKTMTELLAGIPSVIYGFWGLYFIVPLVRNLQIGVGVIPYGVGVLTASIVLAIMIIPYSASIGREVLELVPNDLKEGAYSLGATRYEVIKKISVPYSISGILAGVILSLGRALGETMAVTMLIGNRNVIPEGIFAPGQTIASIIANQFNEANNAIHVSAMIQLGLILLIMSAIINFLGKYIIKRLSVKE